MPPPPPPLPTVNQRLQNASSQHQHVIKSTAGTPPTHGSTKYKQPPPTPEKSWKRRAPLPPKSGKLYSSQDSSADATASGRETQRNTASRSDRQTTTDFGPADEEIAEATFGAEAGGQHEATDDDDFRRELGDRSYISLALTEPVPTDDQRRRIAVVRREQLAEPADFAYGWTSSEQKKREQLTPGSYRIRHSRATTKDFETAATAF